MFQGLKCVCSQSDDVDTSDAIKEIILDSTFKLNSEKPKAAIVWFDINHDASTLVEHVYHQWPDIQLVGCSSYGEFNTDKGMVDGSIQLILLYGEDIEFSARYITGDQQKSNISVACQNLVEGRPPAVTFLFSDVLKSFEIENIIDHLNELLPPESTLVGGMAADEYDFVGTNMICNQVVQDQGCVVLNVYGNVVSSMAISIGWSGQGHQGVVTHSEGRIVYEVDNKPIREYYIMESGGAEPNIELPFTVFSPDGSVLYNRAYLDDYIESPEKQGMNFFGKIPQNSLVQISSTSKDYILDGIKDGIDKALKLFPSERSASLGLFFSCASRRVILSSDVNKEAEAIKKASPSNIPGVGFYTFGEVGNIDPAGEAAFHNNSLVCFFIG